MSLNGKTVLVTGGTNGIGRVTALELARLNARVLIVGRDANRGQETLEMIKAKSGNDAVELLLADLSLMRDTRRLASEIQARAPTLDVLVNNAGAVFSERHETSEGLEMTFALNHISYFLLTNMLLPQLRAAPAARVVNVSSEAHRGARINFADLQSQQHYSAMGVYGISKLMNILFTTALARRLTGTPVTVNALHPGVVSTGFGANTNGLWKFAFQMMHLIPGLALSPERGAQTSLYLASSEEVKGVTGSYFNNKRPVQPSPEAQDASSTERLWLESERIAGLSP